MKNISTTYGYMTSEAHENALVGFINYPPVRKLLKIKQLA